MLSCKVFFAFIMFCFLQFLLMMALNLKLARKGIFYIIFLFFYVVWKFYRKCFYTSFTFPSMFLFRIIIINVFKSFFANQIISRSIVIIQRDFCSFFRRKLFRLSVVCVVVCLTVLLVVASFSINPTRYTKTWLLLVLYVNIAINVRVSGIILRTKPIEKEKKETDRYEIKGFLYIFYHFSFLRLKDYRLLELS